MQQKVGSWGVLGVGAGVLFFHFGQFWSATWWSKWGFLALAFNLFFCVWAARRTSWYYFPLMLYVLTSSTFMAFWAQLTYAKQLGPIVEIVLQKDALFAWITGLAVIWAFAEWKRGWSAGSQLTFHLIWAVGVCAYLCMPKGMPPNNGWYFGNPSMGAGLLAALLPALWDEFQVLPERFELPAGLLAWFLTALVIWRTGTSIPIGVLWLVTASYLIYRFPVRRTVFGVFSLTVFMAATGFLLLGHDFLDENGRTPIYKLAASWSSEQNLWHLGWGSGAFQTVMPILQITHHVREHDYFMWMHSDWLQFAVEFGYAGVLCLAPALARLGVLTLNNEDPASSAMLWGFMGMALFNYPLRMPITAFVLLLVVARVERHAPAQMPLGKFARSSHHKQSLSTAAQSPL